MQHGVRVDYPLTSQTPTLPFSDQRGSDIYLCHRFVYAGVFGVHRTVTPAPLGAQQGGHWVYQTTDCRLHSPGEVKVKFNLVTFMMHDNLSTCHPTL